jgi:hypothetical protein
MSLYDIARACYYDPGYVWEHYGKPTAWMTFIMAGCAFIVAAA